MKNSCIYKIAKWEGRIKSTNEKDCIIIATDLVSLWSKYKAKNSNNHLEGKKVEPT